MLVTGFAAGPWATNCWAVAPAPGSECVIIDPGMDALEGVRDVLAEHRLKPVAVLATHGHVDHIWSLTPIADGYGIPAYIHGDDRMLLSKPELGLSAEGADFVRSLGADFSEPARLEVLTGDAKVDIAGLEFEIRPAPGHTPGSTAFFTDVDGPRMFSGDLLFRMSIGRVDLPGGSMEQMLASLDRVVRPADPATRVHCGHGPDTTIGVELAGNPYLQSERSQA